MPENSMLDKTKYSWIETIEPECASPELEAAYKAVGIAHGKIHNLYRAFSLQPKPLESADRHYRDILHNSKNESEPWLLELLATQAAILAECEYAFTNHGANFVALIGDEDRANEMLLAIREGDLENASVFTPKQAALLCFGEKLSLYPEQMTQEDIKALQQSGLSDVEILESVQATACFAYWVRFINALGIQLGSESIGLFDENGKPRGRASPIQP